MKRDMDLIRNILLDLEDGGNRAWEGLDRNDEATQEKIGYHSYLLFDAGLIGGANVSHLGCHLPQYSPTYLTWSGHEFLDAARNETNWKKAKETFGRVGGFVLPVLLKVLVDQMMKQVGVEG